MALELKSPKVEVTYEGKEYVLSKPKLGMSEAYGRAVKETEKLGESSLPHLVELLEKCGLPKEVTMDLDMDLLDQLVSALMPKKKD